MSQSVVTPPGVVHATALRCQRLVEPLGVAGERPALEWVPAGGAPTAYQVLVASDAALLEAGRGDLWDSGRVASTAVTGVAYAGVPLPSRTRAVWSVRLWDADGEAGPLAPAASFEVGLRESGDWQGTWIGAGDPAVSSPLLRTEFALGAPVVRARAYVAALGYAELRLNGVKVGDRVLDPPQTSYDHDAELLDGEGRPTRIAHPRVLYTTHDVTGLVQEGDNAVGLVLGHGWWSAEPENGPGPLPRKPWGDRPGGRVQLEIETADGARVVVAGDGSWRAAAGPIVSNDYAQGEHYDARREQDGWDRPGFDGAWSPAAVLDAPAGELAPAELEPIRVIETRAPVAETTAESGARLLDFGQHVSGWTRIAVAGPAGASVTLRHAGELTAEGELDDDANMGAWLPAAQTERYVLRGEGTEEYEPRFTLHGFRHVEIAVSDPAVRVERAEARVVHSDLESIGEFACSDELLNQIHRNVQWTHRASFQGFPQDAAERNERVGWVGDPGWAIEDYLFNFEARAFWLKWLDDLADAQLPDGRFPVICPIMWRGGIDMAPPEDYEVPDDLDTMVYWPYGAWVDFSGTSHPAVAWELYRHTGDRAILERHYPVMRRGVEFLRGLADAFVVSQGLGDHMEPQADGTCEVFAQRTPVELTSTAWFFRVTSIVADVAQVLGDDAAAAEYRAVAADIRTAFNARFYDRESASYATGSQTARVLPLWFGLVEDDERERVLAGLVERIRETDDGHLDTGTMGTAALQQVLGEGGHADLMYEIATQTTFPSWGHQVAQGATTVWETWGGQPGFSRNMKLMASIETFLYRDVAGLAPAAPGWERIVVQPRLTDRLTHGRARVRTVRGEAAVAWRVQDGELALDVTVPAASTAEVRLPDGETVQLGGGAHELRRPLVRAAR